MWTRRCMTIHLFSVTKSTMVWKSSQFKDIFQLKSFNWVWYLACFSTQFTISRPFHLHASCSVICMSTWAELFPSYHWGEGWTHHNVFFPVPETKKPNYTHKQQIVQEVWNQKRSSLISFGLFITFILGSLGSNFLLKQ